MDQSKINYKTNAEIMPFSQLSNYQLSLVFQSAKRKYTEMLENNPLQAKLLQDIPNLLPQNLKCQYHDDNSFNNLTNGKSPSLSLLHINLQSSTRNYSLLKAYLSNLNLDFDIIGVSEAGVNNANLIKNTFNSHFIMYKKPSDETTKGGAAFFNRKELFDSLTARNDFELNLPLVEDLWIQVDNTVIAVIYRHPKANSTEFTEKLELNLEKIINENKIGLVCGDININLMDMTSADV
ncbi:hypothetical protein CAPTEDRAFT_204820 [Capitella teleta]|uniref:Endonuclease/exonuclease/phosphatase domain-containing protein n=1 Tax=Capitella teleta TaxID=283909 RepID=R7U4E0_CAPTE|nr:hypothetical protein CAPTEDRAFT_204820 [Capitella teleta]|eukprot:ELU01230.1 hypothetical protein CAPTEDRAFT_204820 [Capitella teleta]